MKLSKASLLVIAGVLLAGVLFSFKNDEPKKEYLTILNQANKFIIINPDGSQKEIKTIDATIGPTDRIKLVNDLNATINGVAKEGWVLVESVERKGTDLLFIFERNKQ